MGEVRIWYLLYDADGELVNRTYDGFQATRHAEKHEGNEVRILTGKGKSFSSRIWDKETSIWR